MTELTETTRAHRADARHLARHQVMGLAVLFLLGMAVNLIGQPSQAKGSARTASTVLLAAHVLIALGLVVGAVLVIRATPSARNRSRQLAILGAAAIAAAFAAGLLSMITNSNWWSYGMALGFIASLLAYGGLLITGTPPSRHSE
ncbi:MAG: hypothetical protein ACR2MP_13090 [Streptosporangiaceae bacterium]